MDREPLNTLYALQIDEPAKRDARRARREAEHLGTLISRERLECAPPPDDDWVRGRVAVVLRRSAPLVDVNVRCARDEKFDFLFVEL